MICIIQAELAEYHFKFLWGSCLLTSFVHFLSGSCLEALSCSLSAYLLAGTKAEDDSSSESEKEVVKGLIAMSMQVLAVACM